MIDAFSGRPGPMPFRLLLDEAIRQARRHFRAMYPAVAIPVALFATAIAVAQAQFFSRLGETGGIPGSPFGSPGVLVLTFVYLAIVVVAYNAMQVAAVGALSGQPVEMKRAWRFTLRGRVLGTILVWYLTVAGSLLCCCLPVLYVAPLLSFVPPVMADEARFGFAALSRSAELARHNPERRFLDTPLVKSLAVTFVGLLLSYALSFLVNLPFQVPMWVDMFRSAASGEDVTGRMGLWMWLQVPAQFLSALASSAVYLYVSFGIALLFFDTRGRKEGSDLQSDIESMFPPAPPPAPPPGEPSF